MSDGGHAPGTQPSSPFSTRRYLERARALVRTLAVASTSATLYPMSHPAVWQAVEDLAAAVTRVIDLDFESVTINIYKNTVFVEDHVLPEESATYARLLDDLQSRGISAVTFDRTAAHADAEALVALLSAEGVHDLAGSSAFLAQRGTTAVSVAETTIKGPAQDDSEARRHKDLLRSRYDQATSSMQELESQIKLGKAFEVGPVQGMVSGLLQSLFADPGAMLGLTAIKSHDDYTLNHSINVCILAMSLGASLGLAEDSLRSLGLSALLYDLGKVRIPEEVLHKQEPLTAEEWKLIRTHSAEGAALLKGIQLVDQLPMVVAYEHHQRHDGAGYPEPTGDAGQHLFSRIVALCDAYDAMTTSRPFRREIRPDKAVAVLMRGRGKAYDPALTKSLVSLLGIYPIGAVVRLSDGALAVVYRVHQDDLLHPKVRVLIDPDGRWIDNPPVVDLRVMDRATGRQTLAVTECLPAAEVGIGDVWEFL